MKKRAVLSSRLEVLGESLCCVLCNLACSVTYVEVLDYIICSFYLRGPNLRNAVRFGQTRCNAPFARLTNKAFGILLQLSYGLRGGVAGMPQAPTRLVSPQP